MIDLKYLLEKEECPIINAVFMPTGEMLVLEYSNSQIRVLCKSNIASFFVYNQLDYTSHFSFSKSVESEHFIVSVGEGSWGGDGVVQVYTKQGELLWFMFIEKCNPFINAIITENMIEVISSSDIKIQIPIYHPEYICIANS